MIAEDQIYEKIPDFVFRRVGETFLLVPVRQRVADLNAVYNLNDVAAFIWELLDGRNSLGVICGKLTETYEIEETAAREDLFSLIETLMLEKAIRLVSNA